jgi:hypothetical protein
VALALDRLRRLLREQQNVDEHGMADIVRTGQLLLDRAKSVATGMSPKQLTMVLSCLAHLHGRLDNLNPLGIMYEFGWYFLCCLAQLHRG